MAFFALAVRSAGVMVSKDRFPPIFLPVLPTFQAHFPHNCATATRSVVACPDCHWMMQGVAAGRAWFGLHFGIDS
jgi:hypothetical protein